MGLIHYFTMENIHGGQIYSSRTIKSEKNYTKAEVKTGKKSWNPFNFFVFFFTFDSTEGVNLTSMNIFHSKVMN